MGFAIGEWTSEIQEALTNWTNTARAARRALRPQLGHGNGRFKPRCGICSQINDESTLVSVLKSDYNLTPRDPRYTTIMQIWRDAQQRLQHER
jgi:hypothetical protein